MVDQLRGLLFDKDGTLFHYQSSMEGWAQDMIERLADGDGDLAQRLGKEVGFDITTKCFAPSALIVRATGEEVIAAWRPLLPEWEDEAVRQVAIDAMEEAQSAPVCDLAELLGALRAAGYRLGIATNDYAAPTHQQLKSSGIHHLFDFIAACDSGYGAKPGPGMAEGFARELGLLHREVAMIGDTNYDLRAGKAAGAGACIAVLTGTASAEDLSDLADEILPSIADLPAYLERRARLC